MTDQMRIYMAEGTWVVRAAGAVIGESARALELSGPGGAPVIYFPRDDIAMAFLDRSEKQTASPVLGTASHYTIAAKSGPIADAAWSYETPAAGMEAIAGHLAFAPDKVTVERL
ncbi:DUF427 domain-containing protein [Defluviimonas sp. WL0024]|uniref:DUF427 domain-containing protein n=2 Tax=Albidovulum TaxID=205889 RepID=A0ABT3J2G3_9RHOB|nr:MULTISPECIES: DUF427 domain-containing protein [Defluviimonas]MCU9847709.1 DUF427 domain-containing protein [Defluviimonas sp. WL0024]MCW3781863.1 DUF427 domain-containing protein [Defluviimonas salinarum]